ncbi:MAG: protein translocase subunit SecF [Spirochaetes bacterium]|nr:protein translocase subunit SecF [Spirochaetota bacterium]
MRRIIRFSRLFVAAAVLAGVVIAVGVIGFFVNDGFNLGLDFQAGLVQEVQVAPTAFSVTWDGAGNAILDSDPSNIYLVISGAGVESRTVAFNFSQYGTVGALAAAMMAEAEGLEVQLHTSPGTNAQWLLRFGVQGDALLRDYAPFSVHYLPPGSPVIPVNDVRDALEGLRYGEAVVQIIGAPEDRHFLIRLGDQEEGGMISQDYVVGALESYFGAGGVMVLRADFVSARFAQNLTDQIGLLLALTLLLIFMYCSFRFKVQYATAAIVSIMYDAVIVVGFLVWSRMEFNTITIAAILTILGYSTNDTIVVFDRIRENRRLYPDDAFIDVVDRSLTGTLNRTIITTLSTLLAVAALFIFTTGTMRDFALALMVGMISGVFTTTFIATGIVYFWEVKKNEREKRKRATIATGKLASRGAA